MSIDRATRLGLALALAACAATSATRAAPGGSDTPAARAVVLDLHCDALDTGPARAALAQAPAPRLILLQGALPFVPMDSLARFLVDMGYPEARIRDPRDGALTASGYLDSVKLAGIVAWHYEHDGMPPILVGHSRGGMVVVRTLHELAGAFRSAVAVWDPVADAPLDRTTIVDPHTGSARPVVGLAVRYAAALATGTLPRILAGEWAMAGLLHDIPDSVRDFTGYQIDADLIADGILPRAPYVGRSRANVRNVTLPARTGHLDAVRLEHLAANPDARAYIESYRPETDAAGAPPAMRNVLQAADLWHGIRRAWCEEAQEWAAPRDS